MKKIIIILIAITLTTTIGACQKKEVNAPEFHTIPYAEGLETTNDEYGADTFGHMLDNADSKYYKINDYYNMKSGNGLHIISEFETYQQTTVYSCGGAVALMVLHHFGDDSYNELEIGKLADTTTTNGTSVEGLVKFFEHIGWKVDYHANTDFYFKTIEDVETYFIEKIDQGIPIMVDWVDWSGHWQAVIGIDTCNTDNPYDDVLILADPYDVTDHYQDGYYIFPFGRFFEMWREGPCAEKSEPYVQPFVVAEPIS